MEIRVADIDDIDDVLKLHNKYQIANIKEEDKADGFVTTAFSKEELKKIILEEQGLFITKDKGEVIAYVMAASWQYWSAWPMFEFMIKHLSEDEFVGLKLDVNNSYQYGPICIDKRYRGTKVLKEIFEFARAKMAKRYKVLVTFINKINPRSYEAHTKKLGLEVLKEFEFNENQYYQLCYDTAKVLK